MAKHVSLPPELEGERILELPIVSELSTLSIDSIKRNHGDKIIQLSKRRLGMKLKHAIALRLPAA